MTKYETDKKTGDVSKLVKKAYYNPKITEKEGKIPSNTGQATTSALNSVENKIFNVSGLVKKKNRFWCKNIRYWHYVFVPLLIKTSFKIKYSIQRWKKGLTDISH